MSVIEHVSKKRIKKKIKNDGMQFAFRQGKGTTDAIFVVKDVKDTKGTGNKRKPYRCFIYKMAVKTACEKDLAEWEVPKQGL